MGFGKLYLVAASAAQSAASVVQAGTQEITAKAWKLKRLYHWYFKWKRRRTRSWTLDVLFFIHPVCACPHSQVSSKLFNFFAQIAQTFQPSNISDPSLSSKDMKRICGTMVATKKGRAGREGKLGNYNQMINLQFTWEKQWILKRGFNVQKNYKTSSTWKMASQDLKGYWK